MIQGFSVSQFTVKAALHELVSTALSLGHLMCFWERCICQQSSQTLDALINQLRSFKGSRGFLPELTFFFLEYPYFYGEILVYNNCNNIIF